MHAAQTRPPTLTVGIRSGFTAAYMTSLRGLLVLLGIVLIQRAYVRSGG